MSTVTPIMVVGEAIAGQAAKARKQLEKLIKDVNRSSFDIGDLLHNIKKNGWYEGYTTFQEYTKSLDVKPRKLQYLRRIAEVMEAVGIVRDKYEPVGIAKLREITSLDPNGFWTNPEDNTEIPLKDFIVSFIDKADEMELEDIKKHVRTLKGFVGENDLVFLNVSVKRSVMDNTVRPALELAKNAIGSVGKDDEGVSQDASDGAALEAITAEFLANPANNVLPESEG